MSYEPFIADDGALYLPDKPGYGFTRPFRPNYRRTFARIETVAELKATLRAGRFTSLGCYPLFFVTADGAALSFESARRVYRNRIGNQERRNAQRLAHCRDRNQL